MRPPPSSKPNWRVVEYPFGNERVFSLKLQEEAEIVGARAVSKYELSLHRLSTQRMKTKALPYRLLVRENKAYGNYRYRTRTFTYQVEDGYEGIEHKLLFTFVDESNGQIINLLEVL